MRLAPYDPDNCGNVYKTSAFAALKETPQLLLPLDSTTATRYYNSMIASFSCKETEKLFHGRFSAKLPQDAQRTAQRKLKQLHAAAGLDFLRVPPGNGLEPLSGNRAGQWSIRINDQWRICFRWHEGNAHDVEIIDYH